MWEWRILQGYSTDLQEILNQWQHDYYLYIRGIVSSTLTRGDLTIVLTR